MSFDRITWHFFHKVKASYYSVSTLLHPALTFEKPLRQILRLHLDWYSGVSRYPGDRQRPEREITFGVTFSAAFAPVLLVPLKGEQERFIKRRDLPHGQAKKQLHFRHDDIENELLIRNL